MEMDWCRNLESRSCHSRRSRWTSPRLAIGHSIFSALLFECSVLPLVLVSDFNRPGCFEPSRVPSRSSSTAQCHNILRSGGESAPSSNAWRPEMLSGGSVGGSWTMAAVSLRLLLQFDSGNRFSRNYAMERIPHLPRMNASNHLRRAVSSLTREAKGIVFAINMKDRFQFAFWVLVGCSGQVQCGRHAGSAWGANRLVPKTMNRSIPDEDCDRISGASPE